MLIDWFTVIAQAFNFLILVGLLKHFLYKPILKAIDDREKRIASAHAEAAEKKSEAQKEIAEFNLKSKTFDDQRADLLNKARSDAHKELERLLDEAKKSADALSLKRQESLEAENSNLLQEIRRSVQQEVFAISRKVLIDLSGVNLEERMVDIFAQRLHDLNEEQRKQFVSTAQEQIGPALIRTTFDLSSSLCTRVENVVKATLGSQTQVQFQTAPDLVSGIELTKNGKNVAWNVADYLTSLEKSVEVLLKEKSPSKPGVVEHGA